jgi:hypothetical protein
MRETMGHECSSENGKSRGKLPLGIASVFKPILKIYVRNVAFLGIRLKTTRKKPSL